MRETKEQKCRAAFVCVSSGLTCVVVKGRWQADTRQLQLAGWPPDVAAITTALLQTSPGLTPSPTQPRKLPGRDKHSKRSLVRPSCHNRLLSFCLPFEKWPPLIKGFHSDGNKTEQTYPPCTHHQTSTHLLLHAKKRPPTTRA